MSTMTTAQAILLHNLGNLEGPVRNRANLGPGVDVRLFQALRLIAVASVADQTGKDPAALAYKSGQRVGRALGNAMAPVAGRGPEAFFPAARELCLRMAIGSLVLEEIDLDRGRVLVRLDETVSCAGILGTEGPLCDFEAGFLAGLLSGGIGKPVRATELACAATGSRGCRFELRISDRASRRGPG